MFESRLSQGRATRHDKLKQRVRIDEQDWPLCAERQQHLQQRAVLFLRSAIRDDGDALSRTGKPDRAVSRPRHSRYCHAPAPECPRAAQSSRALGKHHGRGQDYSRHPLSPENWSVD